MRNFPCFNVGDYINILITVNGKRLRMNYDNLFMFQPHPVSLKQVFRTGGNRLYKLCVISLKSNRIVKT